MGRPLGRIQRACGERIRPSEPTHGAWWTPTPRPSTPSIRHPSRPKAKRHWRRTAIDIKGRSDRRPKGQAPDASHVPSTAVLGAETPASSTFRCRLVESATGPRPRLRPRHGGHGNSFTNREGFDIFQNQNRHDGNWPTASRTPGSPMAPTVLSGSPSDLLSTYGGFSWHHHRRRGRGQRKSRINCGVAVTMCCTKTTPRRSVVNASSPRTCK